MYIGFDYGTANCSVAHIKQGQPQLLALENASTYIPSTLAAPNRESVSEYLFRNRNIKPLDTLGENMLRRAMRINEEEGIDLDDEEVAFGQAALDLYLEAPRDVYYVKSPKSFLGAAGLREQQLSFFEDLVCAMMDNIKTQAELSTEQSIESAVIGRPINFQGSGGEAANSQAQQILTNAAKRAGFKQVEFQFEPVAAGLEYEASLTQDQTVLVVDIGGGTTDCSMIQMGPSWQGKPDRSASLLGHKGQRVGGNDLDIALAFKAFMQPFGKGSALDSGLVIPTTQFWNPIAINNIDAQNRFYSRQNLADLSLLHKEAQEPSKLARLLEVYHETLGYQIVRRAEEAKIGLSEKESHHAQIQLVSELLELDIARDLMIEAIETPVEKMTALARDVVAEAGVKPDAIFMTGGSARSPILRDAVAQVLPDIPIVSGNYFGSVTAGLARWAQVCFE